MMRPLPRGVVRQLTKSFKVKGTSGEREHRHRRTHPYAAGFELLLPEANLALVVMFGENQVRLHPWDPFAGIGQQFPDSLCIHTAVLVQLFPAGLGDRLDPAFDRDAMG